MNPSFEQFGVFVACLAIAISLVGAVVQLVRAPKREISPSPLIVKPADASTPTALCNERHDRLQADLDELRAEVKSVRAEAKADINSVYSRINSMEHNIGKSINDIISSLGEIVGEMKRLGGSAKGGKLS